MSKFSLNRGLHLWEGPFTSGEVWGTSGEVWGTSGAQLAPVSRQATGSLRQGTTLSQNAFAILCLFLLGIRAYDDGLKGPQKPETYCDNKLFAILSFTSCLYFRTFSSRPWRNLPPTWVIHMATHRPAHNTPIHMDLGPCQGKPHKKSMWIGVLWGWSAGRHVDRPCGWQFSPWPARKVTDYCLVRSCVATAPSNYVLGNLGNAAKIHTERSSLEVGNFWEVQGDSTRSR